MSVMSIIGLVLWVLALLFGSVNVGGVPVENPLLRVSVIAIALPIIGVAFSIIGLLGLVLLAPVLQYFGWEWFITIN